MKVAELAVVDDPAWGGIYTTTVADLSAVMKFFSEVFAHLLICLVAIVILVTLFMNHKGRKQSRFNGQDKEIEFRNKKDFNENSPLLLEDLPFRKFNDPESLTSADTAESINTTHENLQSRLKGPAAFDGILLTEDDFI